MVRVWLEIIVMLELPTPRNSLKKQKNIHFYQLNNDYKLIGEIITTKELMECE